MLASGLKIFARLPSSERLLALESGLLLGWLLVALRCVGVRRSRLLSQKWALRRLGKAGSDRGLERAGRIVGIVQGVARRFPGGSRCLDRSVAALLLLRREGIDARLVIGVRRSPGAALDAHAWVELNEKPLGEDEFSLAAFAAFDSERLRDGLMVLHSSSAVARAGAN